MVQPEARPQEEHPRSIVWELVDRRRLAIFGLAFAVELVIFFSAMLVPIAPAQQQQLINQANNLLGSTGNQSSASIFSAIFSNNARVALVDMVPAVGAVLFLVSIYTTGQVIQALALASHVPGPVFGVLLFLFPFALVELSAYAIAVASGTMLMAAWRRKNLEREVRVFIIEIIAVVFCVLVAAAMETVGIVAPLVGLSLWLPMAAAIFALAMLARGVPR